MDKHIPDGLKKFSKNKSFNSLDKIFPGEGFSTLRAELKERGIGEFFNEKTNQKVKISADFDPNGKVVAMAAAIPREPTKSEDWLTRNVPDFFLTANPNLTDYAARRVRLMLYHRIADKEGIINNAIRKTSALVAQKGEFDVREVRQGKRPKKAVVEELRQILNFWADSVNSNEYNSVVTGSRGVAQVIRRGAKQAMIEGDVFLRTGWKKVKVPTLDDKEVHLPMILQAIPSYEVFVPYELAGTAGYDIFYWKPSPEVLNALLHPIDPAVKTLIDNTIKPKLFKQLKETGRVLLDPALLMHIKHGGIDTQTFGKSIIESAMADLAYSRSLKALDFVTIDSLINRMLVIKIGDPNEKSDYHNLAVAQQRVNVFRRLVSADLGPNMTIVWAGHDVDKLDMGAHDALLDTETRHELAKKGIKDSLGVPDSMLTGSIEGSARGAGWLGFIALSTVVEELKDEFAQNLTQLGLKIAKENGFEQVDLKWVFNSSLIADQESNAKIMLQAYDRGLLSRRTILSELDKDYSTERLNKEDEKEAKDDVLFKAPEIPKGGPGGNQGTSPSSKPGRPSRKGNPKSVGPERKTKDKPAKKDN